MDESRTLTLLAIRRVLSDTWLLGLLPTDDRGRWRDDVGVGRQYIDSMPLERVSALANRVATRVALGRVNAWFWAHRPPEDPASYLADEIPREPHRLELLQRLGALNGESYLELGSGVGANLALLLEQQPDAKITGIEINKAAAEAGTTFFSSRGHRNVIVKHGRFQDSLVDPNQVDVVFSCISLCIAPPQTAAATVRDAVRAARTGLVFVEPQTLDGTTSVPGQNLWAHDYEQLLRSAAPAAEVSFDKIADAGGMPTGAWTARLNP